MKLIGLRPPRIAFSLLIVSAALHFTLREHLRLRFSCLPCGLLLAAFGFGVMIWAWSLFRLHGTPIRPTDQAVKLVTAGPFRFSRNPMYLGMLAILLGVAVSVGSLPMLLAPLGFFFATEKVFIPYEEDRLHSTFGGVYESYQLKVRRWI